MVQSSVLGFPRMGVNRDLKKATEAYWAGKISMEELLKEGKRLRLEHWTLQKAAGVDIIPSNDFAYYDHVLDHIQLFNVSTNTLLLYASFLLYLFRLYLNATPTLDLTLTMYISQWDVVTRKMASMCLAWYAPR
jgi:hypothetical protein